MPGAREVTTVSGVSLGSKFSVALTDVSPPACVLTGVTVMVSFDASAVAGKAASIATPARSPTPARPGRSDTWLIPPLELVLSAGALHPQAPTTPGRIIRGVSGRGGRAQEPCYPDDLDPA